MSRSTLDAIDAARGLDELYPILDAERYTAGWHKKRRSLWPQPRSEYRPLHWRYAEAAQAMDRAGTWMSTEEAERRNLLMFNPVGDNDYDTVRTIVAAYQMIKPGERARAHRHTANAMRLVLDGEDGVFTVVDGQAIAMRPGDLLLTPNWCWHSHFNQGRAAAYWVDVLDVPLVHRLEPMFMEEFPSVHQEIEGAPDPDHCQLVFTKESALSRLADLAAEVGGAKRLRLDTQAQIPTLTISYLQLPAGAALREGRSTASRIFVVVSGEGRARLDDLAISWSRGDVFCLPSWRLFEIASTTDALLLDVSDAATLEKLGFLRKEDAADPPALLGAPATADH